MLARFNLRIPAWVAVAVAALGYVTRSVLKRFDFSLELPLDALIVLMLVIVLAAQWWAGRADEYAPTRDGASEKPTGLASFLVWFPQRGRSHGPSDDAR